MEGNVGLGGRFIATVKAYNKTSRELEVYIPKLMPAISENQRMISTMTNYGNNSLNSLSYASEVTTGGTINVRARDTDEKIPDIGSKVFVEFLEGNPELGIWYKCNINNDYAVIEDEKYSKLASIVIDGKEVPIFEGDRITINLPDELSAVILKEDKDITLKLTFNDNYKDSVSRLQDIIGNSSYSITQRGLSNDMVIPVAASGLISRIEATEEKLPDIPYDDGDYSLKVSKVNGKITYKWVKD